MIVLVYGTYPLVLQGQQWVFFTQIVYLQHCLRTPGWLQVPVTFAEEFRLQPAWFLTLVSKGQLAGQLFPQSFSLWRNNQIATCYSLDEL